MVMQKDTEVYPGSGKGRPYVQRGERVCIILHLSACTGVNTSVVWSKVEVLLHMGVVLCDVLPPVFAPGPPLLLFHGEAQGTSIGVRVGVDRVMAR